jgi:hypothetical protein
MVNWSQLSQFTGMQHLLYIATLLSLAGCKTTSEASTARDSVYIVASIETSGCLGRCPVYQAVIFSDRTFNFNGIAHTQVIGEVVDTLSSSEWQSLLSVMHRSRFHDLDSAYVEPIMDAPTTSIFMNMDGRSRKVQCRGDAPPAFLMMQRKLQELADARAWIRGAARKSVSDTSELIIELHSASDLDVLLKKYEEYELSLVRRLGPNHEIYLFATVVEDDKKSALLDSLRNDGLVKEVQWNRRLKQRK